MTFEMYDLEGGTKKMAAIQLSCNEANTMNTGIPKSKINLGMLIHAFHPIVQKAEAGGTQ